MDVPTFLQAPAALKLRRQIGLVEADLLAPFREPKDRAVFAAHARELTALSHQVRWYSAARWVVGLPSREQTREAVRALLFIADGKPTPDQHVVAVQQIRDALHVYTPPIERVPVRA